MKEIWVCDSGHYTTQKPETNRCKCKVYDGAAICNGKITGRCFYSDDLVKMLEEMKIPTSSDYCEREEKNRIDKIIKVIRG